MTVRIAILGGPRCGKTTLIQQLYVDMKIRDINVGVATEYSTDYLRDKGMIESISEQYGIYLGQLHLEKALDGHEYAVTDYATFVPYIYGRKDSVDSLLQGKGQGQFYFNMAFSHVNWKQPISLVKNTLERSIMTINKQSYLKGFCTVSRSDKGTQVGELQNINFDSGCEEALREILVYLQAQNIENVLFVRFPHQRKFENPEAIDKIGSIISEYGYDILNLNDKSQELGIDVPSDYSDAEHLNINGMEKMTEYLGKYIIHKYDVSSGKSTKDIVKWNKCVKKTKEMVSSVREDMKGGICRLYYEASIYWKPKIQK